MIKYLKYLFTLLIILFIVDRAFVGVLDLIIEKSDFRFNNLKNESVDFYVFGNSRGVNSFNEYEFEKTFNLKTLNVSFNGLHYEQIKYLISKIDSTKKIIVEISPFLNAPLINLESGKIEKISRFNSFKHLRNNDFFSDILKTPYYNNQLTLRALYYLFSSDKSWQNNKILSYKKLNFLLTKEEDSFLYLDKYRNLKKYLDENNYDYLMYFAPIHPKKKQKILNWNTINNTLRAELGNKYIDLSDLILDDNGFADLLHTNHNSSTKINKEIYEFIKINYLDK
jgi:hypothetical protein